MNESNGFDQLAREIKDLIKENKKFLDRMMDEDFEPEEEELPEDAPEIEL